MIARVHTVCDLVRAPTQTHPPLIMPHMVRNCTQFRVFGSVIPRCLLWGVLGGLEVPPASTAEATASAACQTSQLSFRVARRGRVRCSTTLSGHSLDPTAIRRPLYRPPPTLADLYPLVTPWPCSHLALTCSLHLLTSPEQYWHHPYTLHVIGMALGPVDTVARSWIPRRPLMDGMGTLDRCWRGR